MNCEKWKKLDEMNKKERKWATETNIFKASYIKLCVEDLVSYVNWITLYMA